MGCECIRCGIRCRVDSPGNPNAKMLRRSKQPKGLCVNCAVHDFLRNTYPANMLLAESGPKALALPHIQEQFAGIMRAGFSDAVPDEIDWDLIIENWDLPFPNKMKKSNTNPCSQLELFEISERKRPGLGARMDIPERRPLCADDLTITSCDQLNDLEPGLGDELRRCVEGE